MILQKLRPMLSRMLYIPLSHFTYDELLMLRRVLTIKDFNYVSGESTTIRCYCQQKKGFIGIPREFGMQRYADLRPIDMTVKPDTALYDYRFSLIRGKIQPRDAEQRLFMESIYDALCGDDVVQVLANASTGTGKTVTALYVAALLGIPTLITVPRERLKEQWLGSVEEKNGMRYFFGNEFVRKHVGIVQQDTCDYKNKLFCVAMVPSLARRVYDKEFYNHFGLVIHDEAHMLAAPLASSVFQQFPAAKQLSLTATNRKGPTAKVCDLFMGKPKVVSQQESMNPIVYRYTRTVFHHAPFFSDAAAAKWLTNNVDRNKYIANLIYTKGYKRGRNILVLSDSVKQLQILHKMFVDVGIPEAELGLYVGEKYRTHKGKILTKKEKVPAAEYQRIVQEARILFATYSIFGTGNDVKRLDMGVEASPRRDLVQAIGRITRHMEGKPDPEWYTITDVVNIPKGIAAMKHYEPYPRWVNQAKARIASYRAQKATIINVKASNGR